MDARFLLLRRYSRADDDWFSAPVLHASKKPPLQPVNLNTATALELQQVPGIGPSTADKIVKIRKWYGSSLASTICARSRALAEEGDEQRATSSAPPSTAKSPPKTTKQNTPTPN